MYNPDYPTDRGYGFAQHTYQPAPHTDMFYWGGSNGFGPSFNDGSRRNMFNNPMMNNTMNPTNPVAPNPFQQYGNQSATIPESAVQPFSSYPPSTPMPNNGGLNSMVESRRNVLAATSVGNQNNPWAVKSTPPVPSPSIPTTQTPSNNAWGTPNPCNYYGPNEYNSLYNNHPSYGFNKQGRWENYYTQTRTFPMPNIDWNNNNMQNQYNQYGYPTQNCGMTPGGYGYNPSMVNQFPTAPLNWKDKATENWSL